MNQLATTGTIEILHNHEKNLLNYIAVETSGDPQYFKIDPGCNRLVGRSPAIATYLDADFRVAVIHEDGRPVDTIRANELASQLLCDTNICSDYWPHFIVQSPQLETRPGYAYFGDEIVVPYERRVNRLAKIAEYIHGLDPFPIDGLWCDKSAAEFLGSIDFRITHVD